MAEATSRMQHATAIAFGSRGVLLLGKPGSGKSSLALQLIDSAGYGLGSEPLRAQLVADDQVRITRQADRLVASVPPALRGKLEVRGIGILDLPSVAEVELSLAVILATPVATERLPEPQTLELLGLAIPAIGLDASLPAAPARLRAALSGIAGKC